MFDEGHREPRNEVASLSPVSQNQTAADTEGEGDQPNVDVHIEKKWFSFFE